MTTASVSQTAELAWGFTMDDVEKATAVAIRGHLPARVLDYDERSAVAWHGAVTVLYAPANTPPRFFDLVNGARGALDRELADRRRLWGISTRQIEGPAPAFTRYWVSSHRHYSSDDGFSERLCEHLALRDALGVLTADEYNALVTLAAFDGDGPRAAAAVGINLPAFQGRLDRGRKKIKRVWYGDETPPNLYKPGETCKSGHSRAQHGRKNNQGFWVCAICARNKHRRRMARER